MHAASLFRSISPISGYIYDIDKELTKGGTFCVDGICVDSPGTGTGIFLNHGVDDTFVRPTGCCSDPDKPKCCCGIAADTCVPIMEVARNWALEVNKCEVEEDTVSDSVDGDDKKGEEEGGEAEEGEGEKEDAGAKFVTSYTNSDKGIECLTTVGTECKSNTTICMHDNSGHFNSHGPFGENFPFARQVIDFFAKDACEINEGTWDETSGGCACPESHGGKFCLDDPVVAENTLSIHPVEDAYIFESGAASSKKSQKGTVGSLLFAVVICYAVRQRYKSKEKKDDRYFNDVRDEENEEAAELVSSRGFRTN